MAALLDAAAGWIHVLWAQSLQASVVFAVVLAASRLLRRRGPAIHLALWSLVFARLLLPPGLSHPWSLGALMDRWGGPFPVLTAHGAELTGVDGVTSRVPPVSGDTRSVTNRELDVLAACWLLGCGAVLVVRGRRAAPYRAVATAAVPVTQPEILETAERWRRRLRIRRGVRVVTSSARVQPFTIGVVDR